MFLELSPKDSALPDWNGWNKLGRTKLVRTVDVTQKESPPAPKGCTILTPCYTECQPAFDQRSSLICDKRKGPRVLPCLAACQIGLLQPDLSVDDVLDTEFGDRQGDPRFQDRGFRE